MTVETKVRKVIAEKIPDIDMDDIVPEASLIEDLGAPELERPTPGLRVFREPRPDGAERERLGALRLGGLTLKWLELVRLGVRGLDRLAEGPLVDERELLEDDLAAPFASGAISSENAG